MSCLFCSWGVCFCDKMQIFSIQHTLPILVEKNVNIPYLDLAYFKKPIASTCTILVFAWGVHVFVVRYLNIPHST